MKRINPIIVLSFTYLILSLFVFLSCEQSETEGDIQVLAVRQKIEGMIRNKQIVYKTADMADNSPIYYFDIVCQTKSYIERANLILDYYALLTGQDSYSVSYQLHTVRQEKTCNDCVPPYTYIEDLWEGKFVLANDKGIVQYRCGKDYTEEEHQELQRSEEH